MRNISLVVIVSTGLFLGACGGGGGGGGGSMVEPKPPVTQPQPDTPLFQPGALQTSYELQHSVLHVDGKSLLVPRTHGYGWTGVAAYGDFDGDGDEDVIHAPLDGTANPSSLEMYLNDGDGEYRLDNRLFGSDVPELVHPRKLLTGDFNGDGRLDVFAAGHGYDKPPYPGEAPVLLLSSEQGLRKQGGVDHIIGFHHGAASADIDHDGDLDIFVTSQFDSPFFLMNDGGATSRMIPLLFRLNSRAKQACSSIRPRLSMSTTTATPNSSQQDMRAPESQDVKPPRSIGATVRAPMTTLERRSFLGCRDTRSWLT